MTRLPGFGAALLDPDAPVPPGVVGRQGIADQKRFAVYRNNVFVGLVGVLEARFPVTARLVGEDFFRGMARVYAGEQQPASPVMMHYGDDFPDFIRRFPPAASLAYLGDVAAIEAKWSDAYNAADAPVLGLGALAGLTPDQLAAARLAPHPAAQLVVAATPAGSIWAAHQTDSVAPVTSRDAETMIVTRPMHEVKVTILPAGDTSFTVALFAGATIGAAAETVAVEDFDAGAALIGLISLGCFSAIL